MSSEPALPAPIDEGWHTPDTDPLWSESYYLDAVDASGELGCYVRTGRLPNRDATSVMLAITGRDRTPVVLALEDAPPMTFHDRSQQLLSNAVELDIHLVDALASTRVTFSGLAPAFDDPADALRGLPGRAVEVTGDLTWHTDGIPYAWRQMSRYEIPCRVTGTITVDGARSDLHGPGQRDHSWGARDWWSIDWCWSALHLNDGTRLHTASSPDIDQFQVGYHQRGDQIHDLSGVRATAAPTSDGLFGATEFQLEPACHLTAVPVAFAPVRLVRDDGLVTLFPRALCEVSTDDGRTGSGWVEWNRVQRVGRG